MPDSPQHTMVFLGKVNRFDRKKQLNYAQRIVEKFEFPDIGRSIYDEHEVSGFIEHMRGNEVAVIPFLSALATTKSGRGITKAFYTNAWRLDKRCRFIVSLDTTKPRCLQDLITARSDDDSVWWNLVGKTGDSVSHGRALDSLKAKKMNKKKVEKAPPGLVQKWELKLGDGDYMAAAMIWGNLTIVPAEKAIATFPDSELQKASKSTIDRIFGSRKDCAKWLNENL